MGILTMILSRSILTLSALSISAISFLVQAATVPEGFRTSLVASGLNRPISMAFAPNGQLLVCEQDGRIRLIKNGVLLTEPFLTLTNLDSSASDRGNERGLLSVVFDPNFSVNRYVYVFYTAKTPTVHNRISRFTAKGNVAARGSEKIILELEDQDPNLRPGPGQGGAMHFGTDGKLYISVGVGTYDSYPGTHDAQNLTNYWGKMLRINRNGKFPADNPFYNPGSPHDKTNAIWAYGLRVPFNFAVQPGTGRIFINDVGGHPPGEIDPPQWEEINEGGAGFNYGWPHVGGASSNSNYSDPVYYYGHEGLSELTGCAITGGTFYNPAAGQFPVEYVGDYFFADYCNGWINRRDEGSNTVTNFATGISFPVDLRVGRDGSLYYLERGTGSLYKVCYVSC